MLMNAPTTESEETIASVPSRERRPAGLPPGTTSASIKSVRLAPTRTARFTQSARATTTAEPPAASITASRSPVPVSMSYGPRPPILVANDAVIRRELRLERIEHRRMRDAVRREDHQRTGVGASLLPE